MQAWAYLRVSSLEQIDGYGLATQQTAIEEYCAKNGIELAGVYSDAGVSGTAGKMAETEDDLKRPEFGKMLTNTAVKTIIVKHTSRLWRDDNARFVISMALRKRGIQIIAIDQPTFSLDAGTPVDKFVSTIFTAIDELDKNMTVTRMWSGIQTKIEGGERGCGNTPIGYQWAVEGKKKVVIIDQTTSALVKVIFSKYLELQSINAVATWLNDHGYMTQRGKSFTAMGLTKILQNRFYIGELWFRGVQHKGNHEPIISKVQFGKCSAMLARNKRVNG